MGDDNNAIIVTEELKWCPSLDRKCIGDDCEMRIQITQSRVILGVVQTVQKSMCSLPALTMIMSRPIPPPPQSVTNIPLR